MRHGNAFGHLDHISQGDEVNSFDREVLILHQGLHFGDGTFERSVEVLILRESGPSHVTVLIGTSLDSVISHDAHADDSFVARTDLRFLVELVWAAEDILTLVVIVVLLHFVVFIFN